MLIGEESEQARVLVALLVSITFLALSLAIKPHQRAEDRALATMIELGLIVTYLCVLLIKSCDPRSVWMNAAEISATDAEAIVRATCSAYGFGGTADGNGPDTAHPFRSNSSANSSTFTT